MAYQRWWKTVRDQQGNAINGASCTVFNGGLGTRAVIYDANSDDSSPSVLPNPFVTGPTGVFGFMAQDGEYDVRITGGAFGEQRYRVTLNASTVTYNGAGVVLAEDLSAISGAGMVGTKQTGTGAVYRTQAEKNQDLVFVEDYGAVADGVTDNHDAILRAVVAAQALGAVVQFKGGNYATSPISFQGYSNVHLRGLGGYIPVTSGAYTKITFLGTTGIGFQFSDTTNPTTAWRSSYSRIEGFFLEGGGAVDGNGKWVSGGVPTAINYSRGMVIKDVGVRHFASHGIIQEDNCDVPSGSMDDVSVGFCGGHGLWIRPGSSTIMRFTGCQFDGNRGYGMNIEGGSGISFQNVTTQANDRGGTKINYRAGSTFKPSHLYFLKLYTEGNGLLDGGDPNFEGNYALYVTSDDAGANANCPNNLIFDDCSINKSAGGKSINLDRVAMVQFRGTDLESMTIGVDFIIGANTYAMTSSGYHFFPTNASVGANHFTPTRQLAGTLNGFEVMGAWFPRRGRLRCLEFFVNDQAANTVALMETWKSGAFTAPAKGYQVFGLGSIVGITIKKGALGGGSTGIISVRPLYAAGAGGNSIAPANPISGFTPVTMDTSNTVNSKTEYAIDTKKIADPDAIIGMELTTPVGYVAGTNKHILVQLWIEE